MFAGFDQSPRELGSVTVWSCVFFVTPTCSMRDRAYRVKGTKEIVAP